MHNITWIVYHICEHILKCIHLYIHYYVIMNINQRRKCITWTINIADLLSYGVFYVLRLNILKNNFLILIF